MTKQSSILYSIRLQPQIRFNPFNPTSKENFLSMTCDNAIIIIEISYYYNKYNLIGLVVHLATKCPMNWRETKAVSYTIPPLLINI